jgi:hypothetical protein
MLRKVIKYGAYGAFALIITMAAGITYLIFFQTRINEPSECMYKPGSDVDAIYSAMADYYSIPTRTNYPPSMSDLCSEGNLDDLCESFSSIEAVENSITITLIDADGVETADMSKDRKEVIRIHYPDRKCPREIQKEFPEWVDDCVYQWTFN